MLNFKKATLISLSLFISHTAFAELLPIDQVCEEFKTQAAGPLVQTLPLDVNYKWERYGNAFYAKLIEYPLSVNPYRPTPYFLTGAITIKFLLRNADHSKDTLFSTFMEKCGLIGKSCREADIDNHDEIGTCFEIQDTGYDAANAAAALLKTGWFYSAEPQFTETPTHFPASVSEAIAWAKKLAGWKNKAK